jgi:hypothetical protein
MVEVLTRHWVSLEDFGSRLDLLGVENVIVGQNCGPQILDFGPQFWLWNSLPSFMQLFVVRNYVFRSAIL